MRALQSTFRFGAMVIVIFCVSTGLPETRSANATPVVAVGPQYDAAHVYVAAREC
jgi:hypothetical protein